MPVYHPITYTETSAPAVGSRGERHVAYSYYTDVRQLWLRRATAASAHAAATSVYVAWPPHGVPREVVP